MNHKDSFLKILLLDDDNYFAQHLEWYGEYSDWKIERQTEFSANQLNNTLSSFQPDIILLDYKIEGFKDFVRALTEKNLLKKVTLVSGEDDIRKVAKDLNIPRYIQKPIDLESLETLTKQENNEAALPSPSPSELEIESHRKLPEWFDNLSAAVTLYDKETLHPLLSNKTAEQEEESSLKDSILRLMANQLDKKLKQKSTRREDWNEDSKKWLHSRLFDVGDAYWFSRQEYTIDERKQRFDTEETLKTFMERVAKEFLQWGVTRVRLYAVDMFYEDDKKSNNKKNYKPNHLLIPLFGSGDGFGDHNKDYNKWLNKPFTYKNNESIKEVFSLPKGELYSLQEVSGTGKNGCENITWGNAGYRAEIPIYQKEKKEKKEKKRSSPKVIGLLAIDQRTDHLDRNAEDSHLRYAGDKTSSLLLPPLTHEKMNLMKGYIDELTKELDNHLTTERKTIFTNWHEKISKLIEAELKGQKNTVQQFERILRSVIKYWQKTYNSPALDNNQSREEPPHNNKPKLLNWYFVRVEESNQLHVVAGHGKISEYRKNCMYLNNMTPFNEALEADKSHEYTYAIQDFQEWIKSTEETKNSISSFTDRNPDLKKEVGKIKSWLGLPFKLQNTRYLMVVHADETNYFTNFRVRLLRHACRRLSPLLLWVIADESRTWFNRTIIHELNTPLSFIDFNNINSSNEIKNLQSTVQMMAAMINNIRSFNQVEHAYSTESKETTTLKETLEGIEFLFEFLERKREQQIIFTPARDSNALINIAEKSLPISQQVFKEILFNLLNNASEHCHFRYNMITITIEEQQSALIITITNPSMRKLTDEQRERVFLPYYRAINPDKASGSGLGLSVVRRLCDSNNLQCSALATECKNSVYYQPFSLIIPL